MDYNLFDTVKRIWAFGKCAIEIIYNLLFIIIIIIIIISTIIVCLFCVTCIRPLIHYGTVKNRLEVLPKRYKSRYNRCNRDKYKVPPVRTN